jgi:hypothetical protein
LIGKCEASKFGDGGYTGNNRDAWLLFQKFQPGSPLKILRAKYNYI